MKYLYRYLTVDDFLMHHDSKFVIEWKIGKQLMKERAEMFAKKEYFKKIKSDFERKTLTPWPLKDEEVVSWLDTLMLLKRVLMKVREAEIETNNIQTYTEYVVPYGNHLRTDYILVFDREIIVLEFGMFNQDERRSEERYTKKLNETMTYSQVLRNILPKDINVYNYVMIYKPEYDLSKSTEIKENISYNESEIEMLTRFILMVLKKNNETKAKHQLEKF